MCPTSGAAAGPLLHGSTAAAGPLQLLYDPLLSKHGALLSDAAGEVKLAAALGRRAAAEVEQAQYPQRILVGLRDGTAYSENTSRAPHPLPCEKLSAPGLSVLFLYFSRLHLF